MASPSFISALLIMMTVFAEIQGECVHEWITYVEANDPAQSAPMQMAMTSSSCQDPSHCALQAMQGSTSSYQSDLNVDQPFIDLTFTGLDTYTHMGYFSMAVTRVEKYTLTAYSANGTVLFEQEYTDLTSNANLDVPEPQHGMMAPPISPASKVSFRFTKCTQDPQKCAGPVVVSEMTFLMSRCSEDAPSSTSSLCRCGLLGDPIMAQYDGTYVPLTPLNASAECLVSRTPTNPQTDTDDFCGWELKAHFTRDANGLVYPSEAIAEVAYLVWYASIRINASGIFDMNDDDYDISNYDYYGDYDGWYSASTAGDVMEFHVPGCDVTIRASNLGSHNTSALEIFGERSDSFQFATGLCGDCDNTPDDYVNSSGASVLSHLRFFEAMTASFCTY